MWFTFCQNNSGGRFKVTDNVDTYVCIEADSIEHASKRAEAIGIYFDGCKKGIDCKCCGDRWYAPHGDPFGAPGHYESGKLDSYDGRIYDNTVCHHLDGWRERPNAGYPFDHNTNRTPNVKIGRQTNEWLGKYEVI